MVTTLRLARALAGLILTITVVTACGGATSTGTDAGVKPGSGGAGGGAGGSAANGGSGGGPGDVCKDPRPTGAGTCNPCVCASGHWVCSDLACPECKAGETKTEGCNSCNCSGGQWSCTHRACPPDADASAPRSCWGYPGTSCTGAEYCAYKDGEYCGAADATSTCQPRPKACNKIYSPVCGCDGKTYSNECEAAANGAGVYQAKPCSVTTP